MINRPRETFFNNPSDSITTAALSKLEQFKKTNPLTSADEQLIKKLSHYHGLIALGEGLLSVDEAQQLFKKNQLDIVLSENGLTALRENLTTVEKILASGSTQKISEQDLETARCEKAGPHYQYSW